MRYVALVILGCFCVLLSYAYGTTVRPPHTVEQAPTQEPDMEPGADKRGGYDRALRASMTKLMERTERDRNRREAAETLALVYGITAENVDSYREWW